MAAYFVRVATARHVAFAVIRLVATVVHKVITETLHAPFHASHREAKIDTCINAGFDGHVLVVRLLMSENPRIGGIDETTSVFPVGRQISRS